MHADALQLAVQLALVGATHYTYFCLIVFAAAFCTAGRAYAGSTFKLLNHSKASTATGALFAAGLVASESSLIAVQC